MKLIPAKETIFADIEPLVGNQQFESAKQRLEEIHIDYHAEAFVHLQVHLWQFRVARQQRNARRVIAEILPIMFAVPVSYVQKYLGLALPSRMKS